MLNKLNNIAAIAPSMLVSRVHFELSAMVGPQANLVFQRRFDTGENISGSDAVVSSISSFLSKPIPTELFAAHPSQGLPLEWWLATVVNSVLWGIAAFACFKFSFWMFRRFGALNKPGYCLLVLGV